jgi:hypothetical protein
MTDLYQSPVGPHSPFGVPQEPFQAQPLNQQQSPYSPGSYSPPPPAQYGAGPSGALTVETKSPLIALVCGIVSWLGFGWFAAIPAIIFGVKGRRAAREGRTPNGGMATTGLWLGIANLVIGTFVFLLLLAIAIPVFQNQRAKGIDVGLRSDMRAMSTLQEAYVLDNPGEMGFEVAATSPGGTATASRGTLTTHPGNVIAVKVGPEGYCVSAYNPGASQAKSAAASMLFRSESGGLQAAVGVC